MKSITALFAGAALLNCLLAPLPAQDAEAAARAAAQQEAEERYKRLNAAVEDLTAAQAAIQKRLTVLTEELRAMSDELKRTSSASSGAASREDLRKLAETVAELDKQRLNDKEVIKAEIKKLATLPVAPPPRAPVIEPKTNAVPTPGVPDKGYDYTIRDGDTLSGIVALYRKEGIKVTIELIKKANPKLDPNRLPVGKKIFIPHPE